MNKLCPSHEPVMNNSINFLPFWLEVMNNSWTTQEQFMKKALTSHEQILNKTWESHQILYLSGGGRVGGPGNSE